MTKDEVAAALMDLPREERREVLEIAWASLDPPDPRVAATLASWFDGPTMTMTDAHREALFARRPTAEDLDRPLGPAVPPEWSGRTLRELIACRDE